MKRLLTIVLCTLLAFLPSLALAVTVDEIDAQEIPVTENT